MNWKMGSILLLLVAVAGPAHAAGVSDEAKRYMARGTAAMRLAKSPADFRDAVNEFHQATRSAPDWADAWFNLGVAQESAQDYAGAIASFKTYLERSPNATDRDAVQTRIFELEYIQEKAAAKRGAALLQEVEQQVAQRQLIEALQQGKWREKPPARRAVERIMVSADNQIMIRVIFSHDIPRTAGGHRVLWPKPGQLSAIYEGSLSGNLLKGRYREWYDEDQKQNTGTFEGTISADLRKIELSSKLDAYPELPAMQSVYLRQ